MQKTEAAMILAGVTPEEQRQASAPTNLHVITGTVTGKSNSGKTQVSVDGLIFTADNSQHIEIDTLGGLEEGDVATILLTGENGHGMTPLAVGAPGSIDRIDVRIKSIEADYIKATLLEAEVAKLGYLSADSAVIQDLQAGKAYIDDLTANNITADRIVANSAYIKELELDGITTDKITATTGYIDDLTAKNITADKIDATTGYIDDLTAKNITTGNIEAASGYIANLTTKNITADDIEAASGYIDDLTSANITASDISADHATIGSLDTTYATIGSLNAEQARVDNLLVGKASVADLTAANGRIDSLESTKADISFLESDYITADAIDATYLHADMSNADVAWIQNGTIKDGSISNAMINSLSANKLTAGTINGETINVTNINADNITAGTINGQRIGQGSLSLDKLSEDVYTEQEVDNKLSTMQAEIDGAIETWTGTAVPTLNNSPASNWTTAAIRDTHVGDVYFVVNSQSEQNGYNYRFTKSGSTYSWQLIKDSDVTNALQRISTAEGKITTFDSDISTLKTDTGTLKTKTTDLETRMSDAEDDILDKVSTTTFNELSTTVDGNSASISTFSTVISNNGLTETTNITSTVNTVSQTATGNSSKLSQLTTTLGTNADGTTKDGDIVHRTSAVEQDLSGFKTTVSNNYATKTALSGVETTANNANGKSVAYSATSSTGASTAAKVASCANFPTLVAGTTVTVRFSAANTSTGAITLNVNSTGAKTIYVNGAATSSTNQLLWGANANITFTYDGTYWRVVSEPRTWYGSCSTAASTAAKASTINEVVICKGTSVTLNMTYDNTNTSATLNITSTGAKNIYYGTTSTRPTTENGYGWTSDSTVTLVFDGAYWRIGDTSALKGLATVNSTVSQHTTLIEQNSEAIAAKANASDVYTTTQVDGLITTEVNNRNAAIEASADSITTSVSSNYATKTALETVDGKVSSLTTRVSTAETNITQNATNITLKAKKMETIDGNMLYDVDAPNLTKIFGPANRYFSDSGNASFMVCDIRAVTDSPATGIEYMAHWSVSGSSANKQRGLCFYNGNYIQFVTGQKYILSCWVRCTSGKFTYCNNAYSTAFPSNSGARIIDSSVDSGWQFVTTTVTATKTQLDRVYFMAKTLSDSLAFECDMCGFKMVPAAYATQAELKVANDEISSKVSKDGVISSINQSAETVKIQASKVEIDGTAIFSAISSDVDDAITDKGYQTASQVNTAITSKGYATTTQAQGYATTAINNLEIGGRNLVGKFNWDNSTYNRGKDWYTIDDMGTVSSSNTDSTAWGYANGQWYLSLEAGTYQLTIFVDTKCETWTSAACQVWRSSGSVVVAMGSSVFNNGGKATVAFSLSEKTDVSVKVKPGKGCVFRIKVEKGTKGTDWTAAPEDLKAYTEKTVDGIQIGGRNLLLGSGTLFPKTGTSSSYFIDFNVSNNALQNSYELIAGTEYTFSVDVTSSIEPFLISVGAGSGGFSRDVASKYDCTSGRISITFTPQQSQLSNGAVFAFRAPRYATQGTSFTYTVDKPKLEVGNKSTDWTPAPEEMVRRTQRIWYRKSAAGAPATPGTASSNWVVKADDGSNAWTKMHVAISSTEKFIYTCEQYEMGDGTVGYTSVLLDNTITVIDGGNIITGSVTANKLNASNINASKVLTVGAMTDAAASTILNSNVQVGGRNLFRNSATLAAGSISGGGGTFSTGTDASLPSGQYVQLTSNNDATNGAHFSDSSALGNYNSRMIEGETYTASAWVYHSAGGTITSFGPERAINAIFSSLVIPAAKWTKVWKTFTYSTTTTYKSCTCYFANTKITNGAYIRISSWMLEKANKAGDWSPAPEDIKANSVKRTQRIWYRKSAEGAPATPGTASSNWVVKDTDGSNVWTKMHIAISSTEKFIYTCEQYEMGDGTVGYTSVLLDNTITVIDGGKIITGSVSANAVNAASGTFAEANIPNLSASKITTGTIAIGRIPDTAKNENVVVGGRNLLRLTSKPQVSETAWSYTVVPTNIDGWTRYSNAVTLERTDNGIKATHNTSSTKDGFVIPLVAYNAVTNGESLSISFEYRTNMTSIGTPYLLATTNEGGTTGNTPLGNSVSIVKSETVWTKFSNTWTFPTATNKVYAFLLLTYLSTSGGWIEIKDGTLKLEKGNKATDWTPAPEDVTNDINAVADATANTFDSINTSISGVSNSLKETDERLANLTQAVTDSNEERAKWIRADSTGLTIGETGSNYNLYLDNDSVDFKLGTETVATASIEAFVPTALRLGDYVLSGSSDGYLYIDYQPKT